MIAEPKCYTRKCANFIGVKNFSEDVEGDERVICKAFPEGIPDEIAYGKNKHTKPFEGDNGIRYEQ
jgi:hypothetical protein